MLPRGLVSLLLVMAMVNFTRRSRAAARVREASLPGQSLAMPSFKPIISALFGKSRPDLFPEGTPSSPLETNPEEACRSPAAAGRKINSRSKRLPSEGALALRKRSLLATPGIGRLARNGQVTACEQLTVGLIAAPNYERFWSLFVEWATQEKETIHEQTVHFLCLDYADKLLMENRPAHELEKTIAAIVYKMPGVNLDDLPRWRKSQKRYRKRVPKMSRPPIPDPLCSGIVAVFMYEKDFMMALLTYFGQRCQLRPGERLKVQPEDLHAPLPSAGTAHWSVQLAPRERLSPTKTQTFDDAVVIDFPEWLGPLLSNVAKTRPPGTPLFPLLPGQTAERFLNVVKKMGLEDLCAEPVPTS